MRTYLLLLLWLCWTGCQSDNPDSFGIDPQLNQYADEAPVSQKLSCNSVNCETPYSQETYTYRADGRLERIDQYGRVASGKLDLFSYTHYQYEPNGQLSRKIRYGKYGSDSKWMAYDESEFVYSQGVLRQERTYFNQRSPEQRILTGYIDYEFKDDQKTAQVWYDAKSMLLRRVVNDYRNKVLISESWYGQTDNLIRRFDHRFSGNKRQISEYVPNLPGAVSVVEKTYDGQGRLSSEETKVINPLLCAMQAGIIRYVY